MQLFSVFNFSSSQINEMEAENTSLRDTVVEREQEIEESFNTVTNDNSSIEFKELNKRLGELANENMRLRDEMNNYKNILSSNELVFFQMSKT